MGREAVYLTKIIIAEDDATLREVLADALRAEADMKVLGQAGDGLELVEMCRRTPPDVVVVDIRMPGMDGIEAARILRAEQLGVRVLVLTTFDDDEYLRKMFGIGVDGYLLKSENPLPLADAVRAVQRGLSALDGTVSRKLGNLLNRDPDEENRPQSLTEVERRVAERIVQGYYNKDIALEMGISYGRVRNIVSRVYRKLGALGRADLADKLGED